MSHLLLTRGPQEAIRIRDDITIRIVAVVGGKVRLSIEAPKEVPVCREESYESRRGQPLKSAMFSRLKSANRDHDEKAA